MGVGIDEDTKEQIERISKRHRNVIDVYGIALHDYGPQKKLLTMYITVSGNAGSTAEALSEEIKNELGLEVLIGTGNKQIKGIKDSTAVKNNNNRHI